MKTQILLFLTVSFGLAGFVSGQVKLPADADKIVQEFDKWEAAEKAALEQKVAKQRTALVKRLEQILEDYTRKGKLDTALAIRKKIAELNNAGLPVGFVYKFTLDDSGPIRVTFHENGVASQIMERSGKMFPKKFRWEMTAPGVMEYWYYSNEKGSLTRWNFSSDFSTASLFNHKNKDRVKATRSGASN